ncbi:porin [Gammaproteobacteria bacterium]|nr:porin [Gammaproteobacteria bacterium]
MKIKILASMLAGALAMLPVTANAGWGGGGVGPYGDPITIYGWQNHTYEIVESGAEGSQIDRTMINGNAGNIGFLGFVDTGIEGLKVTWRCEQFTYMNDYAGTGGWCNRNSKVGISGSFGEVMFANWLLPYNEMVAGWVDPWYDAGSASHTNIMGSVGAFTIFYNLGDFGSQTFESYSAYGGIYNQGFNRRQEEILQYMGSSGKLSYRFAMTADNKTDATSARNGVKTDPVIYSMGVAYTDGPFWGALTYQKHDEWAATTLDGATMEDSEAESYRIAARYIADLGNGASLTLSAMFENVEYEFKNVSSPGSALQDFGFASSVFDGGTADTNVSFDRDAFLVSGKYAPGGNFDFRFMYAEADDLDVSATGLTTDKSSQTGADTTLFGVFYALGDSTELNVSYIEVENDESAAYGTGISAIGSGTTNNQVEIIQFGILTMF